MFRFGPDAGEYGVTAVENLFIRNFLPSAKGDQVKVYLWGLYQCGRDGAFATLEDAAQDLNLSAPEIAAAMRYWERRGLVTIETEDPPRYVFHSPRQRVSSGAGFEADPSYLDFAESVYAAFGDRRKVRPSEIAQAWEWVQDMGLSPEAVLMLINHMISTSGPQFTFKKAESAAAAMREGGVTSAEDAESYLRMDLSLRKGCEKVIRALGKRGRMASDAEIAMYRKWRVDWEFDHDAIMAATEETVKGEPTMAYLDGILSGLKNRGDARTGDQVEKALKNEKDEFTLVSEVTGGLKPAMQRQVAVNLYRQWRKTFPHGVLVCAADECRRAGGGVEEMAMLLSSWEKKGMTDEKAVSAYLDRMHQANRELRSLFEACGRDGRITQGDRAWYLKWRDRGATPELMTAAAEKALGVSGNKLSYMDSILNSWLDKGITSAAEARAEQPPAREKHAGGKKSVTAQQFPQRTYTDSRMDQFFSPFLEQALKKDTEDGDEQ